MRTLRLTIVAVMVALLGGWSPAAMAQADVTDSPQEGDARWMVADLSALEAAFESGDIEQVRELFTDDGIFTTAWNTIAMYYGEPADLGTLGVNGSGFEYLATLHGKAGEDFTVLGTPIQIGDNTVAFGWEWSSGVRGTALLHLRDGKIVVAIVNPSQARIPPFQVHQPA